MNRKNLTLPDGSRRLLSEVNLSELMEARGMTVTEVARATEKAAAATPPDEPPHRVSRQTLHTWMRGGASRTRRDKLLPVAEALDVTVDELREVLAETLRRATGE